MFEVVIREAFLGGGRREASCYEFGDDAADAARHAAMAGKAVSIVRRGRTIWANTENYEPPGRLNGRMLGCSFSR